MKVSEYFGDWMRVIDLAELTKVINILKTLKVPICPNMKDIFRAFELCRYRTCTTVFIGQDPYPQKNVATGILFGNSKNTPEDKLSPSLKVIKDCVIDLSVPHNLITFDNTLESWAKQGILMLNSALTCELNNIGSHVMLWRPFMKALLKNLSEREKGLIYVLFGKQAQTLKPYINTYANTIIEVEHPAYFARTGKDMPNVFKEVNKILKNQYNEQIIWFKENGS